MNIMPTLMVPDWPAPKNIRALATTRVGGVSRQPFEDFNLGDHVGDDPVAVNRNRQNLIQLAGLPAAPLWLNQVHGREVLAAADWAPGVEADACFSQSSDEVCAVMSADCLPVLLCRADGRAVAAVHAGWRGLAAGVVQQAIDSLGQGDELLAWLGPAIGPSAFEVGEEVRDVFISDHAVCAPAFRARSRGKYVADIYQLVRSILIRKGVARIFGGEYCTVRDESQFFSYRRDGQTGRMASLIWIEPDRLQSSA